MRPLRNEHVDWQAWCYVKVVTWGGEETRSRIAVTSSDRESAITYVRKQAKKWAWLNPKPPRIYVRKWVAKASPKIERVK
jgi:hypothetical protein